MQLKPDSKLLTKYFYSGLIATAIISLLAIPFFFVIAQDQGDEWFDFFKRALLVYAVIVGIIWIIASYFTKLSISNLEYAVLDNKITLLSGIFTKTEKNIPYSKVTDFVLKRTLLDRYLGIGSIKIQTAGQSTDPYGSGYEGNVDGLGDYESIHQKLKERLMAFNTNKENPKFTESQISDDAVLKEILSELKNIKDIIKGD